MIIANCVGQNEYKKIILSITRSFLVHVLFEARMNIANKYFQGDELNNIEK